MTKYDDTQYGSIGVKPISQSLEATKDVIADRYATFDIKRLTKANSFTVLGEVFHIGKKDPDGKATSIYHVARVADKRYVCPSTKSKEDTIKMVQRKYIEFM